MWEDACCSMYKPVLGDRSYAYKKQTFRVLLHHVAQRECLGAAATNRGQSPRAQFRQRAGQFRFDDDPVDLQYRRLRSGGGSDDHSGRPCQSVPDCQRTHATVYHYPRCQSDPDLGALPAELFREQVRQSASHQQRSEPGYPECLPQRGRGGAQYLRQHRYARLRQC